MKTETNLLRIALIGNPNTGKTTLFNSLCGTHQKIGNYPGVTVEKKEGIFKTSKIKAKIYDLPGLYSLRVNSEDEKITFEILTGKRNTHEKIDFIFYIIDASNLKRNLYLLLQILELEIPVIGIITMTDLLENKGSQLDIAKLKEKLRIPLFKVNAHKSEEVQKLKNQLEEILLEPSKIQVSHFEFPENYKEATQYFHEKISEFFKKNDIPFHCQKSDSLLCLTNTNDFIEIVKDSFPIHNGIILKLKDYIQEIKSELHKFQLFSSSQIIYMRYNIIDGILNHCLFVKESRKSLSEKIDDLLTHKIFGFLIFIGIMAIIFSSIYSWASPLMDLIENLFNILSQYIDSLTFLPEFLKSFINDGIISGVGSVLVFVPQIAILFFFIAVLEDSGYLARASFLMDKILSWSGLNGRSFIPLISGFACSVPSIMSTRVINDTKVKKITIFVIPLISCSARLPIYILFIGTFIEPKYGSMFAGLTLFGMHSLGIILAFFVSLFINKNIMKTSGLPFLMELPEYHIPTLKNIYFRVYEAVKSFITRAGTIIFIMSIIIWILSYFPRNEDKANQYIETITHKYQNLSQEEQKEILEKEKQSYYLENSILGMTGKFIEPIFKPLGFDWKLSVGIISSFPAREVIISTLGILYNVGSDVNEESENLRSKLINETRQDGTPVYDILTSISLMIFFALSAQCMSTLVIIKKELGSWRYPLYVFIYMTLLAYLLSLIVYQTGLLIIHHL